MADDFYTRLLATLNTIPTPPPPEPSGPELLTAAGFVWSIFKHRSPSPDDIRCAKHALIRCLRDRNGLGWLIWDQASNWRGSSSGTWSELHERDLRRLIKEHPPWLDPALLEHLRSRNQGTRDMTIDQKVVARMQSRIKQWLSECYKTPRSSPAWEALIRHTSTDRAARYKIMKKAHAMRLVPEINQPMLDTLTSAQTQAQKQFHESRARAQKRRHKRAQKQQQKREEAWRQHRRQARGVT